MCFTNNLFPYISLLFSPMKSHNKLKRSFDGARFTELSKAMRLRYGLNSFSTNFANSSQKLSPPCADHLSTLPIISDNAHKLAASREMWSATLKFSLLIPRFIDDDVTQAQRRAHQQLGWGVFGQGLHVRRAQYPEDQWLLTCTKGFETDQCAKKGAGETPPASWPSDPSESGTSAWIFTTELGESLRLDIETWAHQPELENGPQ